MKECSYIYVCVVIKCGSNSRTNNNPSPPQPVATAEGCVDDKVSDHS
jgi:hypothetical protein